MKGFLQSNGFMPSMKGFQSGKGFLHPAKGFQLGSNLNPDPVTYTEIFDETQMNNSVINTSNIEIFNESLMNNSIIL